MRNFVKVFFGICSLGTSLLIGYLFNKKMSEAANMIVDTL